jgi:hypothetical protein
MNITYYIVTNAVSRTTPLLGIKHILCPDLNISPLRGLCPTHPSKITTDGSDDLSTNVLNVVSSTLNLEKDFQANPSYIFVFIGPFYIRNP